MGTPKAASMRGFLPLSELGTRSPHPQDLQAAAKYRVLIVNGQDYVKSEFKSFGLA